MPAQSALSVSPRSADTHPVPDTRLRGHWRLLVQLICLAVAGLTVTLFLISLPVNFALHSTICPSPPCVNGQLSAVGVQNLRAAGLSIAFYATYVATLETALAIVFCGSALVIVWRKPDDWLALFVALMLITFGSVTFSSTTEGLTELYPAWWWLGLGIDWVGDLAMILFFCIFPTGRFVPRWTVLLVALWGLMQGFRLFLPNSIFDLRHSAPLLFNLLFPGLLLSALATQIYRYRRVSSSAQQQQTKWVVFGITTALGGFLLASAPFRGLNGEEHLLFALALGAVQFLFICLFPLSIMVAVVRYRLWEIDPIINRTLVYGLLTVSVIGLYVVVVGMLGSLFQTRGNFVLSVLATGVAAFLFEPLRKRLQRSINRLMYGERDDPYAVLSRLGRRLENNLAPAAVLPTIVETVAQALKLPYVGIVMRSEQLSAVSDQSAANSDQLSTVLAADAVSTEWQRDPALIIDQASLMTLPLLYQGETIGELRLAPRAPGEAFSPADRRLLDDLAHQAGVAVHAVRLTHDLQRSREQIVTAREEERRRLRRDLHDGLGPQLASQALKLEAVRDLIRTRPERAEQIVDDLITKSQETIGDVRRLVYALRPPALDEFGLLGAIREYARQCETNGTQIRVAAPGQLPPLPAAVEVAAYRIIQEALTNVLRHAQAHTVEVRLGLTDQDAALQLAVDDDGIGLPTAHHAGVGLHSMRERAAELGGDCQIEARAEGGTRVFAQLPLKGF